MDPFALGSGERSVADPFVLPGAFSVGKDMPMYDPFSLPRPTSVSLPTLGPQVSVSPSGGVAVGQPVQEAAMPRPVMEATPEDLRILAMKKAGLPVDWRQGPVGYLLSSLASIGSSAALGATQLLQDLGVLGNGEAVRQMQEFLGNQVKQHQIQQRANIESAMTEHGLIGRGAVMAAQTAVDVLLYLAMLKVGGAAMRGLAARAGIAAAVKGAAPLRAGAGVDEARRWIVAKTLKNAASRAAFRFVTAPASGETEEERFIDRAKQAGLTLAYMSTPALSGLSTSAVKARIYDFALNSGISIASDQYEQAWAEGIREANEAGEPEAALGYALTNLIPIFGTDLGFSVITRSVGEQMARAAGGIGGIGKGASRAAVDNIMRIEFERRASAGLPVPAGWEKMSTEELLPLYVSLHKMPQQTEKAVVEEERVQAAAVSAPQQQAGDSAERAAVAEEQLAELQRRWLAGEDVEVPGELLEGAPQNRFNIAKALFPGVKGEQLRALMGQRAEARKKKEASVSAAGSETERHAVPKAEGGDAIESGEKRGDSDAIQEREAASPAAVEASAPVREVGAEVRQADWGPEGAELRRPVAEPERAAEVQRLDAEPGAREVAETQGVQERPVSAPVGDLFAEPVRAEQPPSDVAVKPGLVGHDPFAPEIAGEKATAPIGGKAPPAEAEQEIAPSKTSDVGSATPGGAAQAPQDIKPSETEKAPIKPKGGVESAVREGKAVKRRPEQPARVPKETVESIARKIVEEAESWVARGATVRQIMEQFPPGTPRSDIENAIRNANRAMREEDPDAVTITIPRRPAVGRMSPSPDEVKERAASIRERDYEKAQKEGRHPITEREAMRMARAELVHEMAEERGRAREMAARHKIEELREIARKEGIGVHKLKNKTPYGIALAILEHRKWLDTPIGRSKTVGIVPGRGDVAEVPSSGLTPAMSLEYSENMARQAELLKKAGDPRYGGTGKFDPLGRLTKEELAELRELRAEQSAMENRGYGVDPEDLARLRGEGAEEGERFQKAGKSVRLTREEAAEQVRAAVTAAGGEMDQVEASGDIIGHAKIGGVRIRYEYAEPVSGEAAGQVVSIGDADYVVRISPTTGQRTTIAHEMGHIARDVLNPHERKVIGRLIGADLDSREGDEAFAALVETPEGRKELAKKIIDAAPADRSFAIRAINKIIRFINAVFGTSIKRIGSAREFDELASGLTDFSLLRRVSGPGTTERTGDIVREQGTGGSPASALEPAAMQQPVLPPTWNEARKDAATRKEFSKWYREHGRRIGGGMSEAYRIWLGTKTQKFGERDRQVVSEIVERAERYPKVELEEGTQRPKRSSFAEFMRAMRWMTDETMPPDHIAMMTGGKLVRDAYLEARREAGNAADEYYVKAIGELRSEEFRRSVRELAKQPPIELSAKTEDGVSRTLVLKPLEAVVILAHSMSGVPVNRIVLGEPSGGDPRRVWRLTDSDVRAIAERASRWPAWKTLKKVMDDSWEAIAPVYKARTGVDLPDKRTFYMTMFRDWSTDPDSTVGRLMETGQFGTLEQARKALELTPLLVLLSPEARGFLKKVVGSEKPLIIRSALADTFRHIANVRSYIRGAKMVDWIETNILNEEVSDALLKSDYGARMLAQWDALKRDLGGVIHTELTRSAKAVEWYLRRATSVRLASPWVVLKQIMSAPAGLVYYADKDVPLGELLAAGLRRADELVARVRELSPYLKARSTTLAYDPFWEAHRGTAEEALALGRASYGVRSQVVIQKMLGWGDRRAVNFLIRMAGEYVRRTRPELSGEEFYREVAKHAELSTIMTQVPTDMMDRPTISRTLRDPWRMAANYLWGARGKQWGLVLGTLQRAMAEKSPDAIRNAAIALAAAGVAQSAGVAMVDEAKRKWKTVLVDDEDEDAPNAAIMLGLATVENLIGTAPFLGGEVIPAISQAVYGAIGAKDVAQARAMRIGRTGPLASPARDVAILSGLAKDLFLIETRLREARTADQRKAIKQRLRLRVWTGAKALARLASETTGIPMNQILELFPELRR